ncbi:BnaA03g48060D [Brassica napus]|uniref:BnaA03g48060D protein n=1 Tax=Brassica napus TaxID=3708 RepID=A0A078I0X3_BRANA|nr:BnaA03g48060D [Brassica napus]
MTSCSALTMNLWSTSSFLTRYSLSTTQNTVATLQLAHIKIFCQQEPLIQPKVVRCCLQYASAIAKASLMSKCVVVDIKEPDSAASAAFRARDDFSDTEIGVAQKRKQFMMRKMNQGLLSIAISKIFNSCT